MWMSNLVCMKSHNVKLSKITNSPKVVPVSESMNTAAREIKDSMTEVQKSALYLKEVSGPKPTLSLVLLEGAITKGDANTSSYFIALSLFRAASDF